MKKKILTTTIFIILCMVVLMGCGKKFDPVGSWYDVNDEDICLNMESDGTALYYDAYYEEGIEGSWSKDGKKIVVNIDSEKWVLVPTDEDSIEGGDYSFVRGADTEMGYTTEDLVGTWLDESEGYEMELYDDGTWDIYEIESWTEVEYGDYEVDVFTITMEVYDYDETIEAMLSDNKGTLTLYNADEELIFYRQQ